VLTVNDVNTIFIVVVWEAIALNSSVQISYEITPNMKVLLCLYQICCVLQCVAVRKRVIVLNMLKVVSISRENVLISEYCKFSTN